MTMVLSSNFDTIISELGPLFGTLVGLKFNLSCDFFCRNIFEKDDIKGVNNLDLEKLTVSKVICFYLLTL